MTMEAWIQGKREEGNMQAVAEGEALLARFGEVPLSAQAETPAEPRPATPERPKVYPEISLEEELARQSGLIIARNVKPLGISEQDARALLPSEFPERPRSFNDENSVPVIVPKFPHFSWGEAVDAARLGMSDYLRERLPMLSAWRDPRGNITPDKPYGVWLYVGDDYLKTRPSVIRAEMREEDRRVGDHWQGLGLSVVRKDIIRSKPFDLVGSSVGRGEVVVVSWWDDRPEFGVSDVGDAYPGFRGLVRGSEIST